MNSSTFVAAHIDTPTLAANQVLVQLFDALALTLDALAIPAQSLVAGALGAGDVPEADAGGQQQHPPVAVVRRRTGRAAAR